MTILDARPALLARALVQLGLTAGVAADLVSWLLAVPHAHVRLALTRDELRPIGQQHQAYRLLDRAGLLEGDSCAHCGAAIRSRACRVVLHGRCFCNESCTLDSLAGRAS